MKECKTMTIPIYSALYDNPYKLNLGQDEFTADYFEAARDYKAKLYLNYEKLTPSYIMVLSLNGEVFGAYPMSQTEVYKTIKDKSFTNIEKI